MERSPCSSRSDGTKLAAQQNRISVRQRAETMLWGLRQVFAIGVLPFTVVVLLPLWIARAYDVRFAMPASWHGWMAAVAGLASELWAAFCSSGA